jgi:hypothetical protein
MNNISDALESQVLDVRQAINSDSYPMSIGELTNLHRDNELIIAPEFQRLFRWDLEQKSRLIESILLRIPLPSIFLSQTKDGKWELIDGLQRVSTILQLQGLLPGHDAFTLQGTKYLPELEGRRWDGVGEEGFPASLQLDFKRAKLDLKIIMRESSERTKYDLFQRLNSFGSPLTPQEMRNALLVGIDPEFARWMQGLASRANFVDTTSLSDRATREKYDEDLVLRFLYLHNKTDIRAASMKGFNQRLDDAAIDLATSYPAGAAQAESVFERTFATLHEAGGPDIFRKWSSDRGYFVGGFSNTAFEIMAMGVGYRYANDMPVRSDLLEAAKEVWSRPDLNARFATGVAAESRLSRTLKLGRDLMAP